MADILCAVCNEPWDAYGVKHGDMLPWEAALFLRGIGCPACEGTPPPNTNADAAFERAGCSLIMNGPVCDDEDGGVGAIIDGSYGVGAWKRPDDTTVFACPECDRKVFKNNDDDTFYWSPDVFYRRYDPLDEVRTVQEVMDAMETIDGIGAVCPDCCTVCDVCRSNVLTHATDDLYSPGASLPSPLNYGAAICMPCYEALPTCAECGAHVSDDEQYCDDCAPDEEDDDDDEDIDDDEDES